MKDAARDFADRAFSLGDKSPETDADRIARITGLLSQECSYSLEPQTPQDGLDPVAHFIRVSHKGHCELFASAATLTLRSAGIPARYITGVTCHEVHPSGRYYVSRLGDAHAWCEAYLRDEGRWTLVEATPASAMERDDSESRWTAFSSLMDWIAQIFQQGFADVRRGYFAKAVVSFIESAIVIASSFLKSIPGMIFIILLCAYAIWRIIKRRRSLRVLKRTVPETVLALQSELKRIEKAVASRTKSRREVSMTLQEWASASDNELGGRLMPLIIEYESLRYRMSPPDMQSLEEFKALVKGFIASAACSRRS